jgi:hypothetical protein
MKPIDFKELAKLVDDWRESKFRLDVAEERLNSVLPISKHTEIRGQKQFDDYMKLREKHDKDFKDASDRVRYEQQAMSNTEGFICVLTNECQDTWLIVECKDKAMFGVYSFSRDDMPSVKIVERGKAKD